MTMQQIITDKLTAALQPEKLEVINESDHHAGHVGSPGTGESHFRVRIKSAAFKGQSRLAIHQQINKILAEELDGRIHALAIEASSPESGA